MERPMNRRLLFTLSSLVFSALVALPRTALAQPPPPELLERLSHFAHFTEGLFKSASYHVEQSIFELDGDGKVSSAKTSVARVESDGKTARTVVERCIKDGKDVTAEEQENVAKDEADHAKKKGKGDGDPELTLPFISDAYDYDEVATDAADPTRVEIAFSPKKPDKHTVEGKAWVDTKNGTLLSVGVKLSKPPALVDWVHFTVEFGAPTPSGPAVSRIAFEAKGGLLFIHKHVRGEVKMGDYKIGSGS
jgi:hypothetical protein